MRREGRTGLALCLVIFLSILCGARLAAQAPGATVTSVDAKTGVVTAKVNSTGQVFTFTLANKALLGRVRAGQGVYVNLGKKQVSLDGKSASGTIVTLLPLGRKPAGSTGAPSGSSTSTGGSGTSANSGNTNTSSAPPCSMPNTWPANTPDTYGKSGVAATTSCFVATCGASATISGNTFPAGSSDWLTFTVPASRANCAMPVIAVSISSVGGMAFDVLASPAGGAVFNSYQTTPSGMAIGVVTIAGLASDSHTPPSPLQPGIYYIRIYGAASTTGTWTLKIAS